MLLHHNPRSYGTSPNLRDLRSKGEKVMKQLWSMLRSGEKGVTTVEYAIMLFLVAIAVATSAPGISNAVIATFRATTTALGQ
jgi:Flp pilus assembly pilin Flp